MRNLRILSVAGEHSAVFFYNNIKSDAGVEEKELKYLSNKKRSALTKLLTYITIKRKRFSFPTKMFFFSSWKIQSAYNRSGRSRNPIMFFSFIFLLWCITPSLEDNDFHKNTNNKKI